MKLMLSRAAGLMGAVGEFNPDVPVHGFSIDSRTLAPGEMFFAVRGERLDGHEFVAAALAKGAAAAVVAAGQVHRFADRSRLLIVRDPLSALQALGGAVRVLWGKPLIAVTGSAGKTTTKEIIARLLATRYRVLKSEGNLNNHFGLPLQLLRLEPEHDMAVVELGMSHSGEITALTRLACPNLGAVTNVAPVHLGFFRSIADIAAAKKELIDNLPPHATAVLNADDEYVSQFGRNFRGQVVTYGTHAAADVRAQSIEERGLLGSRFTIVAGGNQQTVTLPLLGRHNVHNALGAAAVALQYGITLAEAAGEVAKLTAVDKRGQVLEIAGATVVNDCYNSNPKALDSMADALAGMAPGPGGRRIVVAGEMLELGSTGEELHRRCGLHLAERGIDVVIGVRGLARSIVEGALQSHREGRGSHLFTAEFVDSPELAGEWLAREVHPGDLVLLKASRGVCLERALEAWRSKVEPTLAAAKKES